MRSAFKIASVLFVFNLGTLPVMAGEVARAKVGSSYSSVVRGEGCPARPQVDPKEMKECPNSLGEIPLTFQREIEFTVDSYDPVTESFNLIIAEMPDEDETPVTLEAIERVGVNFSDSDKALLKKARLSPCELLKHKFKLNKIQSLSDKDLKVRKNCFRK